MIDFNVYKVLHLLGIFGLFAAFGAAITDSAKSKWVSMLHGVSLLVILIAGFGMLARLGIMSSMPAWVIGKMVIWLALGGALVLAKRKLLPTAVTLVILLGLGSAAAYLALWKP